MSEHPVLFQHKIAKELPDILKIFDEFHRVVKSLCIQPTSVKFHRLGIRSVKQTRFDVWRVGVECHPSSLIALRKSFKQTSASQRGQIGNPYLYANWSASFKFTGDIVGCQGALATVADTPIGKQIQVFGFRVRLCHSVPLNRIQQIWVPYR